MNQPSLPAYILNKQRTGPSLAQRGLANIGAGAGPYLSIEGGRFAFVDIAGTRQQVQTLYVDVVIIDLNDHLSKEYRPETDKWDPSNPTPPACFSDNGLAPSQSAGSPQSPTCASCPHNAWGSRISNMGSKVKACRDIQKCAVIAPGMQGVYRLTITPNALTNFRQYLAKFSNAQFDMEDVVTRIEFEEGVQGTLKFNPAPNPWLDASLIDVRDKALAAKATDMIVGRLDRPRQGQLAAPEATSLPLPAPAATAAVQTAAFPSTTTAQPLATSARVAHPAPAASPSEAPKGRGRRRAASAEGGQAGTIAPFRASPTETVQPASSNGQFGISSGVAPNPELEAGIKSIFG